MNLPAILDEPHQELSDLIAGLLDQELAEPEERRLIQLMDASPAGIDFYCDAMLLHAMLEGECLQSPSFEFERGGEGPAEAFEEVGSNSLRPASLELAPSRQFDYASPRPQSPPLRLIAFLSTPGRFGLVVASVSMVSLLLTMAAFRWRAIEAAPSVQAAPIAVVHKQVGCLWNERSGDSPSSVARGGVFDLEQGWAEVRFRDGAVVVLEGPARLVAQSAASAYLDHGTIVCRADSVGGFTVDTPQAEVVDRGTEFGVTVAAKLATDVQVFEGAVEVRPNLKSLAPYAAAAGQAVRVAQVAGDGAEMQVQPIPLTPEKFVRKVPAARDAELLALAAPPVAKLPVTTGLALWYSADHQVMVDREGGVHAWGDRKAGANKQEENAFQRDPSRRPKLVAQSEGLGGRPAVRFEGPRKGLITAPVALGDEQTILAVFSSVGSTVRGNRQLFNGGGPPHLVMAANRTHSLHGWMYDLHNQSPGNAQLTASLKDSQPMVVAAYVYSLPQGRAELFVAGKMLTQANSTGAIAFRSSRWICCHPKYDVGFQGDLGELLVYNAGLSAEQIETVTRFFEEKYRPTAQE